MGTKIPDFRPSEEAVCFLPEEFPDRIGHAVALLVGAAIVGVFTGSLGIVFLFLLKVGTDWRNQWMVAAHLSGGMGWIGAVGGVAAASAMAAYLVGRFAPHAAGSGVPNVEKVLRSGGQPDHRWVLPVKFFGGVLALGSGLLLGREGPMVQMGAVIGERLGRCFPVLKFAWKPLMAAGAGAGLATAFNAPVGGTVFILEEVLKKVTPMAFVLAATSATVSVFVQRGIFHMAQDFQLPDVPEVPPGAVGIFFLFGAVIGCVGVAYNRCLLVFSSTVSQLRSVPLAVRAAGIGAIVGAVMWWQPGWVGGGDDLVQRIFLGRFSAEFLFVVLVVRFFLGPLSYAAGTPGGLFAPVIALGALAGIGAGNLLGAMDVGSGVAPIAFAVAGMAAFFTATVRAPITGMVICLEMTGSYAMFFPLLATCLGAYLLPTLMKDRPIYDALAGGVKPVAADRTISHS